MSNIGDSLTLALRSAPELNTAPNLALGVAQDPNGDPAGTAQAVAHTVNQNAVGAAVDDTSQKVGHPNLLHKTLGWLSRDVAAPVVRDVVKPVVSNPVVSKGLNNLGAPLRQIQREYRYVHDVEARHGPVAGLLEALAIGSAAAAGGYFGGTEGAIAAGEALGAVQSQVMYKDSWNRVATGADYQGTYNRQTGEYEGPAGQVSAGRDLAGILNLKPGSKPFTAVSAVSDGLLDLTLDPVAVAGKAAAGARSAQGIERFGNTPITAFSHAAQGATPELRAVDLETRVAQLGPVKKALTEIAGMNAGQIVNNYPKFEGLADQLGKADTFDKVVDVFRNNLMAKEMASSTLPSMSFTRLPFAKVSRAIQYADVPGQGAIRSVTSLLPTYFDADTLALSNKGFNLGDPNSIRGVYRVMRFGQSRAVAESVAADFANAMDNPGQQLLIYKNGLRNMLAAKGLAEDSPFVMDTVDQMAQRAMGGADGAVYGADQAGANLSKVATESGSSSLGILASQKGTVAFPDFAAVTREVRSLGTFKQYYGSADDWMYNRFTQGVFKKLVLLSGGFAQRIAAAEAIPAALRQGAVDLVKSRLAVSAAKDLGDEELGHLAGATAKVLGGVNKLAGDADKTDFVVNMLHDNGGHLPSAIDTTTPSAEVGNNVERVNRTIYNAYQQVPRKQVLGDQFGLFGHGDQEYMDAWGRSLSSISNDPASQKAAQAYMDAMRAGQTADEAHAAGSAAAKEYWDARPDHVLNQYGRHYAVPPGAEGVDPHVAWGQTIMDNVKGATHAPLDFGGDPHMQLLANVAAGKQTAADTLAAIPEQLRPMSVAGRKWLPDTTSTLDRIANVGFRKVLDPVINFLSREPLYMNEAYNQYKYLKPLVDSGDLLAEDARGIAQVRAVSGVLPFIHNTAERSQFSTLARNFMPFYFAQEQSYKRFGRVFADNPGAFRQFQLMISGLHEVGSTHTDPNGQSWLTYPGAGFLSQGTVKVLGGMGVPVVGSVPVSFSGQLKSLNTVFPFSEGARPSFGPVVSIASHVIENLFPELTPTVHAAIGDQAASGSIYDQLIPNQTLKGVVQALDPGMRSRSMQNAVMNTIQNLAYRQEQAMAKWTAAGNDPNSPAAPRIPGASPDDSAQERQQLIDHVKNQTRITFLFKTALGAVTPAAPVTNVGDWNLRADVRDKIAKQGVAAGIQSFLAEHPDATPYTVFLSKSDAGAGLPATTSGQDWINSNLDTLHKYPNAGAWFIPQAAGAFNQGVYNEQMAQHLREHKSPEQVMNDIYVAAGNDQFYNRLRPAYKQQLADAQASGDKQAVAAVRSGFSNYIKTVLGPQNPVWWDDLNSADRDHNRQLAVQQMQTMFASGDVPASPQTADIGSLLGEFDSYVQAKHAATSDPTTTQAQVKERWQAYLTEVAKVKPNLQPVIQSIFMQL